MGVQASGFRVQGSRCRVQGLGCRVQGAGCRVQGAGFRGEGTDLLADLVPSLVGLRPLRLVLALLVRLPQHLFLVLPRFVVARAFLVN